MENDDKKLKLYESSENEDNIFISEYQGQSLKNNINYKNWENSMFVKYGKDAKLFHCQEDKIYYYVSNKNCMEYPYYWLDAQNVIILFVIFAKQWQIMTKQNLENVV